MAMFPFTAVVGQESLKTALLLAIVDPGINGVLISGSRGSAKSTLVRSLERLAPERRLVTLPLGATEEMVTGTLKLQRALQEGEVDFAPGLLARADGGLLYVDEVNLLPDHLVDLLLDVSASGVNHVERDGISYRHNADFVLVGTMNPDEGELRPQLLDRFGLMATVQERFTQDERREIVRRRVAYDTDPEFLDAEHRGLIDELKGRINRAVGQLDSVSVSEAIAMEIARRCADAGVDGLRADITFYRAGRAHAALAGRPEVTAEDLDAVEDLVLRHRRGPDNQQSSETPSRSPQSNNAGEGSAGSSGSSIQGSWGAVEPQAVPTGRVLSLPLSSPKSPFTPRPRDEYPERAAAREPGAHRGARFTMTGAAGDTEKKPHWFRTLSDPENIHRRSRNERRRKLHYRYPSRNSMAVNLVLLDTSASTLSYQGLSKAKGVIKHLSRRSYIERARIGIVTFGNDSVDMILAPQRAPHNIDPVLERIRGGGGTPFHKAMHYLGGLVAKLARRDVDCRLFILTDGKVQGGARCRSANLEGTRTTVVDIESGYVKLGLGREVAERLGAAYLHVDSLDGTPLDQGCMDGFDPASRPERSVDGSYINRYRAL